MPPRAVLKEPDPYLRRFRMDLADDPEDTFDAISTRLIGLFVTPLAPRHRAGYGEALGLHIEDLRLQRDDERLSVLGKGGRHRTVLLEDPTLLRLLRRYQRETGYTRGPLFRAERGLATTPLRYQSVQARFASYATTAGLTGSLHDLRHAHAQALVNVGVSLATIRKRLGRPVPPAASPRRQPAPAEGSPTPSASSTRPPLR